MFFSFLKKKKKKKNVVGTHKKCLTELLLTSTHNICFCEVRKINAFGLKKALIKSYEFILLHVDV